MFAWGLRIKTYVPEPTKIIFCDNLSLEKECQEPWRKKTDLWVFCLFRRCFKGFPLTQMEAEGGDREHGRDGGAGRGKEDPRERYHLCASSLLPGLSFL